jgi:hypothetical protein
VDPILECVDEGKRTGVPGILAQVGDFLVDVRGCACAQMRLALRHVAQSVELTRTRSAEK